MNGRYTFSGAWGSGLGRLSSYDSSKRLDIDYATYREKSLLGIVASNVKYMQCV